MSELNQTMAQKLNRKNISIKLEDISRLRIENGAWKATLGTKSGLGATREDAIRSCLNDYRSDAYTISIVYYYRVEGGVDMSETFLDEAPMARATLVDAIKEIRTLTGSILFTRPRERKIKEFWVSAQLKGVCVYSEHAFL